MLHLISKQAYKVKLPKRWRIHNIIHMSLLEYNTTIKKQMEKKITELEFETSNSKDYKVNTI